MRALACNVACDVHPLIVPRVRLYLAKEAGFDAEAFKGWLGHWVGRGLEGLEANLAASPETGRFCHGDAITIADICVSGLAMIASLFDVRPPRTPVLDAIVERCRAEPAFAKADPRAQPGAPPR